MNTYEKINNLDDISFPAGSEQTFSIAVTDVHPMAVASIELRMCPFGDFSKMSYQIPGATTTTVVLSGANLVTVSGKYIQQFVITDTDGKVFVAAQGTVLVT